MSVQKAMKFDKIIKKEGELFLDNLPFKKGTHLEIIILEEKNNIYKDLSRASESSLKFWDNEIDDKIWNNV